MAPKGLFYALRSAGDLGISEHPPDFFYLPE